MHSESLCDACRSAIVNDIGGTVIELCGKCSICVATEFIKHQRKNMTTINSKRVLHREIKAILETDPEVGRIFPQVFDFCEGMGHPTYKFTIEQIIEDHFIDEKGQKWVKA